VTDVAERLERATEQLVERYRHGHDRPLGTYGVLDLVYGGLVAALGVAARNRRPADLTVKDIALIGIATHRLSRTIAKDPITSPVRAPFTRYDGVSAPSELREEVVASGVGHALGELLTCPFCLAQWVATGFVAGMVFAPRATRLAAATFTGVAISDFLQYAYAAVQKNA
jgi:hypothetical protein